MSELAPEAISEFRRLWQTKSRNQSLLSLPDTQLLEDAELMIDGELTNAALIILGTKKAVGKHLAQAEVVFEYRSNEADGQYQQRVEFREGFFLYFSRLWETVNLRNEIYQYREGLFRWDIPTFNENVVREAVLNAVAHRDYRLGGSVFVRQSPSTLSIASPGGFPNGITTEKFLQH